MVLKDPECRTWEWSPMDECCRREIIYITLHSDLLRLVLITESEF